MNYIDFGIISVIHNLIAAFDKIILFGWNRRMIKIFIGIIIAILTFSFGVVTFFYSSFDEEHSSQIEVLTEPMPGLRPRQINVCSLIDNSEDFNGQLIEIEATAYVIGSKTMLSPKGSCVTDNLPFPVMLELNKFDGSYNNLNALLKSRERFSFDDEAIDVKVVGIAKPYYGAIITNQILYSITPNSVKLISSMRKNEPKGAD